MEDFGLNHPDCLELSELHSQAVDYPKVMRLVLVRCKY